MRLARNVVAVTVRVPMIALMAVDAFHSAWAFHAHPHTFASGAYAYALSVLPAATWRFVWLAAGVGIAVGMATGRSVMRSVSLLAYSVACAVFAVSIAELVTQGSPGAFVGAGKWALVAAMGFRAATGQTIGRVIADGSERHHRRRGADSAGGGDGTGRRVAYLPQPAAGTQAG